MNFQGCISVREDRGAPHKASDLRRPRLCWGSEPRTFVHGDAVGWQRNTPAWSADRDAPWTGYISPPIYILEITPSRIGVRLIPVLKKSPALCVA